MDVSSKIKKLRNDAGWSQKELADRIKVDPSTICCIEKGSRNPSARTLRDIARVFNVAELEDRPRFDDIIVKKPLYMIKLLREAKGWSQAELARRAGVGQTAICYIEKKTFSSKEPILYKIAKAFKLTPDKLIGHMIPDEEPKVVNEEPKDETLLDISIDNFGKYLPGPNSKIYVSKGCQITNDIKKLSLKNQKLLQAIIKWLS